jgi:hypothetical protein
MNQRLQLNATTEDTEGITEITEGKQSFKKKIFLCALHGLCVLCASSFCLKYLNRRHPTSNLNA